MKYQTTPSGIDGGGTTAVTKGQDVGDVGHLNSLDSFSHNDEKEALLRSSSSVCASDVGSSTRSTASSTAGRYLSFSSHWLDTAAAKRGEGKDVFRTERDRAVENGIVQAAFLIRDAVLGETENPSEGTYDPYMNPEKAMINLFSLIFRQILSYRLLRQMLYGSAWGMVLLTFVEPPRWCTSGHHGDNPNDSDGCQSLFSLQGKPAASDSGNSVLADEVVDYYPNSRSVLLTRTQSNLFEFILVSFVSLIILLRIGRDGCSLTRYLRRGPAQLTRSLQIVAVGLIYLGLWMEDAFFQPFARLLLLGTLLKRLHHELVTSFLVVRMDSAAIVRGA
jgi:hypothetical protein